MTRAMTALAAGAIGAGLVAGAAGEAMAQGRVVVPIIVNPRGPAAGSPTDTRIVVQPGATSAGMGTRPAGPAAGPPPAANSAPAVSQEVRIISRPPTALPPNVSTGLRPNVSEPPTTRITVDQVPTAGAWMGTSQPTRGFGSTPAFSRETHVTVEQDGANGAPGTRREIQIFTNGNVDTPLIVIPE